MLLVDGNDAGFQCCDALRIVVRANHLVTRFGEAGPRNQSDIATTNNRDPQFEPPKKSELQLHPAKETKQFRITAQSSKYRKMEGVDSLKHTL